MSIPSASLAYLSIIYIYIAIFNVLVLNGQTSSTFYLEINKIQENFTSVESCMSSNLCLDDPGKELSCMCGDEYEEAEDLREQCMYNHTDLTTSESDAPSILGFCGNAFLRLGYSVSTVNISSTTDSSGLAGYTEDILREKVKELSTFSQEFTRLLNKTIVGVYLRDELQRKTCKDAYNEWLCSSLISLYSPSDSTCCNEKKTLLSIELENGTEVELDQTKPCLGVCHRVVQMCPYYLPSQFQSQNGSEETVYGGYPVFDCPDKSILELYESRCKDCPQPYALCEDCCIGMESSAMGTWRSMTAHLKIFVSIFWIFCLFFV